MAIRDKRLTIACTFIEKTGEAKASFSERLRDFNEDKDVATKLDFLRDCLHLIEQEYDRQHKIMRDSLLKKGGAK